MIVRARGISQNADPMNSTLRVGEQLGHRPGGVGAERLQRQALRADHGDRHLRAHVPRPLGGHQRQLVGGKRPGHRPGDDDRQMIDVPALHVLHHAVQQLIAARVVEADGVLVRLDEGGARAHQERIVGQLRSAGRATSAGAHRPRRSRRARSWRRPARELGDRVVLAQPVLNGSPTAIGR